MEVMEKSYKPFVSVSLREIVGDLSNLIESMECEYENLDDLPDELLEELSRLEISFEKKVCGICYYIKHLDKDINYLYEEEKRLQKRRKSKERFKEFLKDYLKNQLEILKLSKFQSEDITVAIQKSPPSLLIIDEEELPVKYKSIQMQEVINKQMITHDLKEGLEIPGAVLNSGKHIRIY